MDVGEPTAAGPPRDSVRIESFALGTPRAERCRGRPETVRRARRPRVIRHQQRRTRDRDGLATFGAHGRHRASRRRGTERTLRRMSFAPKVR